MNVLVIGSGGREHAIVYKISKSKKIKNIYAAPGNVGMTGIAKIVNIKEDDIQALLEFSKKKYIDLVIVGPEVPLVMGIVDIFRENGIKIFGPSKNAAKLEGSKSFATSFMSKYNIPTAKYIEFDNFEKALSNIEIFGFPVVIKADGLAAGKGVYIANNKKEAISYLEIIMKEKRFGDSGNKIILEEFLSGVEASVLCFVDGENIIQMESARDYKRALNQDKGLNTGGMGAVSPNLIYNNIVYKKVEEEILPNILLGIKNEKMDYRGVIFIGLMINDYNINVLEFNVRFGDPETQVILPKLKNNLLEVFEMVIDKRLKEVVLDWSEKSAVCVVLTSNGYPENYETNKEIIGITPNTDNLIFHAGTKIKDDKFLTNGGRVLNIVALGDGLYDAREKVYKKIQNISFEGMHFRTDIGDI